MVSTNHRAGHVLIAGRLHQRSSSPGRIRVNWITAGWVTTPGEVTLRYQTHGDDETFLAVRSRQAPLGRLEAPGDIAGGVAYLVSAGASHVVGCQLNISGGLYI